MFMLMRPAPERITLHTYYRYTCTDGATPLTPASYEL